MGCTCSRDEAKKIIQSHSKKIENPFIIKINVPESDKVKIILFEGKRTSMLLSDVLNSAFFCTDQSEDLDANFISRYNKEKDKFDYYIERLLGFGMENPEEPEKGKVWTCYINNKKENWSMLCELNRIVHKEDEIEFKYEKSQA